MDRAIRDVHVYGIGIVDLGGDGQSLDDFRARWRAAGLSWSSTSDDVLDAAKSWPELAELLRSLALVEDPLTVAAPARPTRVPRLD